MEKEYYESDPFLTSPNPAYLYLTPVIKGAIRKVRYTLNKRQGATCILGDVGVGKSTLARYLFAEYDAREEVIARMIANPSFASDFAFLKAVATEFDLKQRRSILDQQHEIQQYLIERHLEKKLVVLFIDEAQRLSNKMLEVLRSLLNFETDRGKLIQIVISGQLDLHTRLIQDDMIAISSRIIMPTILPPLTLEELHEVLEHRCKIAEIPFPFSSDAIETIYFSTGGTPREALKLCAVAYDLMEIMELPQITGDLVREAIGEATLNPKVKAASHE